MSRGSEIYKKVAKVVSQQDPFNVGVQLKVCSEIFDLNELKKKGY